MHCTLLCEEGDYCVCMAGLISAWEYIPRIVLTKYLIVFINENLSCVGWGPVLLLQTWFCQNDHQSFALCLKQAEEEAFERITSERDETERHREELELQARKIAEEEEHLR